VDVSQDVIIREIDCGTEQSIPVRAMLDGERVDSDWFPLAGRVAATDVVHRDPGVVLVPKTPHF